MPQPTERTDIRAKAERAVLAAVRLPDSTFDERDPFGELRALAEGAGATIVGELEQRRQKPEPGTYLGKGKIEDLRGLCDMLDATMVIFDHDLSPSQIASIERAVERKVVDRSELILDIFAGRATTHEAKLQVELAQLEYTYPRLRAMWSHLERITGVGGIGGIGTRGPGEQQIEIDRRIVQRKTTELRRELNEIYERKRRLVRQRNVDYFTVGLVGYTNAGKSTLFNALTPGGAYADDRLFATLMTRTRQWDLGGGELVMLSDTVGFVRDIPPHLIASFRATLEEATHADLLLVVLDASDPAAELHYKTVMETLDQLDREAEEAERRASRREGERSSGWTPPERLLVLNKVDLLPDNREWLIWRQRDPNAIAVSARDPEHPGVDELRAAVQQAAKGRIRERELIVEMSDSRTVSVLENRAEVLDRDYDGGHVRMTVLIGDRQLDRLRSAGGRFRVVGEQRRPDRENGWRHEGEPA